MSVELEDRYVTSTPEGVSLSVVLAGVGSRGAAYLIDIAVQTGCSILVVLILLDSSRLRSTTSAYVVLGIYALSISCMTVRLFRVVRDSSIRGGASESARSAPR